MHIDISFVITVFNKESELPATIKSIKRQTTGISCEYIFIDDLSKDASVRVIEESFSAEEHCTIIKNKQNAGPAIRLNQGCAIAKGDYLCLIDSDDIMADGALEIMLNALKKEGSDFLFGFQQKTNKTQEELLNIKLDAEEGYQTSNAPLDTVLSGKYVRMAYLVSRELYEKSGGCDERIFIQDESLPLRLAYHANKLISLSTPAIYAPKAEQSLSNNKAQQWHDRFYAYYFALSDFTNATTTQRTELYKQAISTIWKAKKKNSNLLQKISFFLFYLRVKTLGMQPNLKALNKHKEFIDSLENVRKIN